MDAHKLASLICQSSLYSFSPFTTIKDVFFRSLKVVSVHILIHRMTCSHSKICSMISSDCRVDFFAVFIVFVHKKKKVDEKLTQPLSSIASSSIYVIVVKIHYYSLFFYLDFIQSQFWFTTAKQAAATSYQHFNIDLFCCTMF